MATGGVAIASAPEVEEDMPAAGGSRLIIDTLVALLQSAPALMPEPLRAPRLRTQVHRTAPLLRSHRVAEPRTQWQLTVVNLIPQAELMVVVDRKVANLTAAGNTTKHCRRFSAGRKDEAA
jgi:hypothetical protein